MTKESKRNQNTKKINILQIVPFCLAGVFISLAFLQLFDLAGFVKIFQDNIKFGPKYLSELLAIKVILLEISALIFLLNIDFNRWIRIYSLVAGWLGLLFWFFGAVWANLTKNFGSLGFLGSKVPLSSSWCLVGLLTILLLLFFLSVKGYRKNKNF